MAALEHARFALAFSSGSATTATILQSLAQGSHVVSVSDVYGGTHRYFTKVAKAHGVQVTFSPSLEIDVAELIRPNETKLCWIETPSSELSSPSYLYLIRAAFRAATFVTRVERSWDLSHDSHITPKKTC